MSAGGVPGNVPVFGRDLWLLTVAFLFFSLGTGLFFLLPAHLTALSASETVTGLVMGVTGIASIPGAPLVGHLATQGGRRKAFVVAGCLLAGASALGWLWADRVGPLLVGLRLAQGASFACFNTAASAIAADLAPPMHRARALGLVGVAGLLSSAGGPLLGEELVRRSGFPALFEVAAVLSVVALAIWLGVRDPGHGAAGAAGVPEDEPAPSTRAERAAALVSTIVSGAGFAAALNFVPLLGKARGMPRVSIFYVAFTLGAIGVRLGFGHLADRYGRRAVIVPAMGLMAAAVAGLAAVSGLWSLGLAGAALGVGHGLLYPAMYAQVVDRSPLATRARSVGVFTASFGLGFSAGSMAFGATLERFGASWSYLGTAALMGLGLLTYALRGGTR